MKNYLIVIGIILFIAFFTNPKPQEHKELLINKIKPEIILSLTEGKKVENLTNGDALSLFLGSTIAKGFLDKLISVDNYLFFSITKVTWDNETRSIAIGFFRTFSYLKILINLR